MIMNSAQGSEAIATAIKEGEAMSTLQPEVDEIQNLISSSRKLDRDRGVRKLESFLASLKHPVDEEPRKDVIIGKSLIQNYILKTLENSQSASASAVGSDKTQGAACFHPSATTESLEVGWEAKHGCVLACFPILLSMKSATKTSEDQRFIQCIQITTLNLLKNDQTKSVQLAAGNLLGVLCKIAGCEVYQSCKPSIFELITKNLRASSDEPISPEDQLQSPEEGFDIYLPASLIRDKVAREASGWSSLEPSLKCLSCIIENLDGEFSNFVDDQLIDLVWACLSHHNRFVRETGFQISNSLIGVAPSVMKEFGQQLADNLSHGMMDSWNQVRLAASIATRRFLMTFENKESFYPILLPRLCLNRYYKAEGVRVYTQESWRLIIGSEGKHLVAKYFTFVVSTYVAAAISANPAEREAACSSISELVQKIDKDVVSSKIDLLLATLNSCSKDETWSVRDAANLAFANCTKYYPEIAKPFLSDFYPVLFKTLEDPIPLLRQGAASSLATIVFAYGDEAQNLVLDKVVSGLKNFEMGAPHPETSALVSESSSDSSSTISPPQCNSDERQIVTAQGRASVSCETCDNGKIQIFTMESLTTKVEQNLPTKSPVTCPGCLRSQISQPWHLIDGCLYLIGALADITPCKGELSTLIPLISRAASVKSYPEHYIILETVCKIVPVLAKSIGKKPFKEFLNLLFDPIFSAIESPNPATSAIGKQAIRFLAEFIGPNILKSRIEQYDPRFLSLVEDCHLEEVSLSSSSLKPRP